MFFVSKVQRCAHYNAQHGVCVCRMEDRKVLEGNPKGGGGFALNVKSVLIVIAFLLGCSLSGPPREEEHTLRGLN